MLFLIDGNHTCCRDRFGAGRAAIADLTKRRVQAIYRKWKPKQVIACFDQGRSFRHELFSRYKSGRKPIDGIQFDLEVARLAYWCSGVKSISIDSYEADDLIASYATQEVLHPTFVSHDMLYVKYEITAGKRADYGCLSSCLDARQADQKS